MIRTTRRAFLASCGVASLLWIGSAGIESAQRLASQLAYRQLQSKTPAAAIATPRSTSTTTSDSSKGVASLLDQNKDAVGWLVVENTAVSYPLVQASPKNKDWYLHHNFWNQKDVAGCPFIDDRCTVSSQILDQADTKAQTAQEDAHKARQVLTLATCSNAVAGQNERTLIVFSR